VQNKILKTMVLGGQMGPQLGKAFSQKLLLEKKISKTCRPISN
jgi:polyhydroxyalkanoate synthesis regulator phasin